MQRLILPLALLALVVVNLLPLANKENRERQGKPFLAPTWSVLHLFFAAEAILALLIALVVGYITTLVVGAAALHLPMRSILTAIQSNDMGNARALVWFYLPATVLQNVAFFAVPTLFVALWYRVPLREIGVTLLPPRRAVIAGIVLGVAFVFLAGGFEWGLSRLAEHFRYVPAVARMLAFEQSNPVAQMVGGLKRAGGAGLFWGLFAVAVAAPIGEEMLFRGFALTVLSRRFGNAWGLVLSAALFAGLHTYSPLGLSVVFLMGLALGHVYRTGGSIWTTIFIHGINNGVQVLLAFYAR